MSGWLPAGVYAWWMAQLGQDWPVIAAPALTLGALWILSLALRWIVDAVLR